MILRYLCISLCLLGGASVRAQVAPPSGAWRQTNVTWKKPPAELELKQRYSEARILYFSTDQRFVLLGGWPTFSDFFVHHFQQRVAHPCVFCKGGRRCCLRYLIGYDAEGDQPTCAGIPDSRPSPRTRRTGHPRAAGASEFKGWATRPARR